MKLFNIDTIYWYLLTNDYLILVIANCGASVAENCTYFESAGGESGMYVAKLMLEKGNSRNWNQENLSHVLKNFQRNMNVCLN